MKTITLYTKSGCHLCESAEATIDAMRKKHRFTLLRHDICEDPADYERYKHDVPVILVNGVEIARHRLTPEQLFAALSS
jgi:glutaredoxin